MPTHYLSKNLKFLQLFALTLIAATSTAAGSDFPATASTRILLNGPKVSETATRYFNILGKGREANANYGVLDFSLTKPANAGDKLQGLSLTLVQSIPPFAEPGKLRFFLVGDPAATAEEVAKFKFDAATVDGLGGQFKKRFLLGAEPFKVVKTGHADRFALTLTDEARNYLETQIQQAGKLRILVVPDDENVAATYFGAAAAESAQRPKLTIDFAPPAR